MKHLLLSWLGLALLGSLSAAGFAQQTGGASSTPKPAATKEAGASGSLNGRVVDEGEQPLADVAVRFTALGRSSITPRSVVTDEEGNFRFADLPDGEYMLDAETPGYVETPGAGRSYRPGQPVTLKLRKGGVITGRVTNAEGEPVVAVGVSAQQLRNTGGSAEAVSADNYSYTQQTDDRGIYRLYGLRPGSYLVVANAPTPSVAETAAYQKELPAYHPSGPRAGAQPVEVRLGEEASGIDIRYLGERGHLIAGSVTGEPENSGNYISVSLRRAGSDEEVAQATIPPNATERGFTFPSIPDGDYDLIARLNNSATNGAASAPRRLSVKGTDVTGVTLALLAFGSLSGRVVLEASNAALSCVPSQLPALEESSLLLRRIAASPVANTANDSPFLSGRLDAKGEFAVRGVAAGLYYPSFSIREGNFWYLRTFTAPPVAGRAADLSRTGLSFKTGEDLKGVTFYVAPGAALLQGRVLAAEGQSLPELLRVHLIPAEPDAADAILRYAELPLNTRVNQGGRFGFNRVAPGRYRLLVETVTASELAERRAVQAAWNPAERAKLRQRAATQPELELKACEFVERYELRLK